MSDYTRRLENQRVDLGPVEPLTDGTAQAAARTCATYVERDDLITVLDALGLTDRVRKLRRG